jgi:hypothetical protein
MKKAQGTDRGVREDKRRGKNREGGKGLGGGGGGADAAGADGEEQNRGGKYAEETRGPKTGTRKRWGSNKKGPRRRKKKEGPILGETKVRADRRTNRRKSR